VTADSYGNVYIDDTGDNALRVVYEGGTTLANLIATEIPGTTAQVGYIYTIAGNPTKIAGGGSGAANAVGTGVLASTASFATPEDVIVDNNGNIFIADEANHVVRVIYVGGTKVASLISLENSGLTPQVGYIYTIMGGGTTTTYTPNTAVLATSINPTYGSAPTEIAARKIAMDSRGDIFLIDSGFNVVWFLDASTGYMRTIAGIFGSTNTTYPTTPYLRSPGVSGVSGSICTGYTDNVGDGCPAAQAVFSATSNSGMGIAIDGQDNLYLTDPGDARIRKIAINSLFAATTPATPLTQVIDVHLGKGETATPGIAFPNGNPDFSQSGSASCNSNGDSTVDCLIGVVFQPSHPGADASTLLVTGTSTGVSVGLNGTGTAGSMSIDPGSTSIISSALGTSAQQIAVDGGGNIYLADAGNDRILYFPASGAIGSTIAGGNGSGYSGDNGPALSAQLNGPKGVAVDAAGNIYIADTGNNVVRRVDRVSQLITTLAGGAGSVCPLASDAYGDDCPAAQTIFSAPAGVATDSSGDVYVSDSGHNLIRVIAADGYSYLYAGGAVCSGETDAYGDGCVAAHAAFLSPAGLAVDASSNLYVADAGDNLVRKVAYLTGIVTAVAGDGQAGFGGDGGSATSAQLSAPEGVAVDAAGDVFIADTGNAGLRIVNSASGYMSTLAGVLGSSGAGTVPGSATQALLKSPLGVAVNSQGSLAVADSGNGRLLQIQRSSVSYNFGTVNVGSSSDTRIFTVTSTGTGAITVNSPPFPGSGSTADLTLVASTTQGCSNENLAAGTACSMTGEFSPTKALSETATYTLNSTAANAVSPAIVLSGTGKFLISTSIVAVQTVPASGNPQYGQAVTVSASVTPASATAAMTGTITFKIDGVAGVPIPIAYASGVGEASVTISSQTVGSHTVTAIYSGDFNYASANNNANPLTVTVSKAKTTTSITSSPAALLQFSAETITATVVSTTTGTPTGTVTFFNGTTPLGPASSLNSSGVATLASSTLAVGAYQVTGVYSGDGNYATSTSPSNSFTVNADPQDFELTLSTASLAIASGATVQTTLYITPTNTLADTLTFQCSGLPQYATCTFGPPSTLAVAATTNLQTYWQQPIPVTVTFWSDVAPVSLALLAHRPGSHAANSVLAVGWPLMMIGLGGLAGSRNRRRLSLYLAVICLLAGTSMTFSGCSSAVNGVKDTTPVGTSNVTITVTGKNSATHVVNAQYTITGPGF
jgi:sugar lactone lactonase YvrE